VTQTDYPLTSNPTPSKFVPDGPKDDDSDDDRVSLAPLGFEQAVTGLLTTPPPKKD